MFASRLRLTTATGGSSLFLSSLMWATSEGVGLGFVLDIEAVRRGCVKLFREVAVPKQTKKQQQMINKTINKK